MEDKKISDFTSTNALQDNEYIPTELLGVENRKITLNDFANQIQERLLKLSFSDIGSFKPSVIAPVNNKQSNLLYCDGAVYYASNPNILIAKFINSMYENLETRNLFEIPADKSSMKLPDLRDRHLVGSGANNTILSYQDSKVMDILSNITASSDTTITNGGSHTHTIADITGYAQIGGTDIVSMSVAFKKENTENQQIGTGNIANGAGSQWSFSSHRAGVTGTGTGGSHTHTASTDTTLSITKNTAIIDSINRVPALAIYWYIDIAVDRFTLDPNASEGIITIDISQVNGLQTVLDSKVDDSELTNYATNLALDSGLSGKANTIHTHIIDDIDSLQTELDGKANTIHTHLIGALNYDTNNSLENWLALTYAPINHTHSIYLNKDGSVLLDSAYIPTFNKSIATKEYVDNSINPINTTLNKYNSFGVKYVKSGLTQTINSSPTTLTNIINIVNNAPTSTIKWASDKNGNNKPTFDLISVANGFKLPIIDGLTNYGITFNIRVTGALSGATGTPREFIFYLRRLSDNSIVANDSIIKVTDNNINGRSATINSYVISATDPFITGGFYIDMLNNSGSNITLSTIELYINGR
jgi:hypothetical protein